LGRLEEGKALDGCLRDGAFLAPGKIQNPDLGFGESAYVPPILQPHSLEQPAEPPSSRLLIESQGAELDHPCELKPICILV